MGQADLPVARAAEHIKAFERAGWALQPKRGKGSHHIMTKPGSRATLSIPAHGDVKRGLLARLVSDAGLTVAEYCDHFKGK